MLKDKERLSKNTDGVYNTDEIRRKTDECYYEVLNKIAATNLLTPSPEVQELIDLINALIKQTKHSYNLSHPKKKDDETEQQ